MMKMKQRMIILNIIIYLKDEIGLRIVPYDKNNELDKFISIEKKEKKT